MKIFLSWSGERSKEVAQAFHEWLPSVLQAAKTWFSPEDIKVGKSWRDTVVTALEENNRGLLFLTQENASAAWVMFEAGALSKNIEDSSVCPVLCGITPTDLIGPLSAFQAIRVVERDDVWKLIKDYNEHIGESRLEEAILLRSFDRAWPELDKKVKEILGRETPKSTRKPEDIADETLVLVRQIHQELDNNKTQPNLLLSAKCRDAHSYARYLDKWTDSLPEEEIDTFRSALNRLQEMLAEMYEDTCGEKLNLVKPPPPQRKSVRGDSIKISDSDSLITNWSAVLSHFKSTIGEEATTKNLGNATPLSMDEESVIVLFNKEFYHAKALDALKRLPFQDRLNDLLDKPRVLKLILVNK